MEELTDTLLGAARDPLSDPINELKRQEAVKKLVFAVAEPGSVEFDNLLDKVLEHASLFVSPATPSPASEVDGDGVKRPGAARLDYP